MKECMLRTNVGEVLSNINSGAGYWCHGALQVYNQVKCFYSLQPHFSTNKDISYYKFQSFIKAHILHYLHTQTPRITANQAQRKILLLVKLLSLNRAQQRSWNSTLKTALGKVSGTTKKVNSSWIQLYNLVKARRRTIKTMKEHMLSTNVCEGLI
jgi:hypothetical protein